MESVSTPDIIRAASNLSVILPLVVYLSKLKYASKRLHIIGGLVIISGLCDLIGIILFSQQQSTVVLFNAYYTLVFLLLAWFYYEILFINTRRVMIWIGIAIYLQSFILITLYVQSFFEYQTVMWVITAIIMIIYSVAYFLYSFSNVPSTNIFGYSYVWINSGVLIYFCMNLFLFVMGSYVLTRMNPEMSLLIWSFHNVNNVIKNILFAVGIYFYKKKMADF